YWNSTSRLLFGDVSKQIRQKERIESGAAAPHSKTLPQLPNPRYALCVLECGGIPPLCHRPSLLTLPVSGYSARTVSAIPPRAENCAATVASRGEQAFTKSSRMRLATA